MALSTQGGGTTIAGTGMAVRALVKHSSSPAFHSSSSFIFTQNKQTNNDTLPDDAVEEFVDWYQIHDL